MKRGLYVYAVLLCIFLLLTSSCIKNKESKTYDEEGLLYYTENGEGYHYYANARSNAVEAWFHGIIPETAVKSEGLRFVDYVMEKTRIVIGRTEPFTKDSLLFSITGYNGNKKPYKTYMPDYPASLSEKRDNTNYPNDPPYLLGDFNDDLIVNLIDFSIFVSHYQSSAGQGGYNVVCDISPAVNAVGGIWSEIIDTPYPDGNVNLMDFSNFVKNYQKTHPGEGADSPDNPPGNIDHDSLSSQQIRFKWEDRCSNEIEYFITRQVQGHSDEKYTCPPNTEGATITVIPNRDNFLTLTMRTTTSGYSFVSDPLLIHPVESQTEEEIRFSYDGQEVSLNPELLPEGVLVSFSVAPETGNIITEFVFDTEGMEEALNGGREETEIKGFHAFYSIPIHYTPKSADVDAVHVTVQQEYDWWEIFNPYKTLIRLLYPNTYAADYRLLSDNKGRTFFYFGNIKNLFEALLLGTFDLTDSFINKLLSNFSPKRVKVKYEPVTNKYPSISEIIDYKALHWWVNFGNDPDPFTNDKAIIYVHGLGRNAYSTGVIDYWRAFFETEVADFDLDDYDKFAYWYDTQVYSAKEYGEKLSEFLINNGFLDHYSQIHIISHSMGTIVTRYAMNHNGLGDYITNAFLLNGVLEGSYLANITDYVLDLATNIKTNTPRVMIRDYELAARFLELVKLLIEANEIDNLVDWVKITAFGNLLYELCASAPGVACDFLINGGDSLGISFQPNPGGKSIRYANEIFLNRLGRQFIGDVFEHDEDLKELNEKDQYKDKYTAISSSIQIGAEYPEGLHQFGLRAFGVVMRQIAGDIQGGVHLLNDGMVPLWSQKMQGHNAGMNEDQFWHYENLDHEEIKQNPQTIKDIYRKIANSPNPGEMILVEGGSFQMGNTRNDSEGRDNEKPVHTVNLTYDYRIGKYEVTFDEYDAFCDATGRSKPGDEGWGRGQRPVINVSWWDAIAYCNWLSDEEGYARAYDQNGNLLDKSGNITPDITKVEGYRLPTEAEWEYAARGGSADITNGNEANDYKYAGSNTLSEVGWYWDNSDRQTHPVGQKRPNELGLYDMSGNVEEWCHDRYDEEYYKKGTQTNPIGPSSGSDQVNRGRAWYYSEWYCRVADRGGSLVYGLLQGCRVAYLYIVEPPVSGIIDGFRLVRTVF